MDIPIKVIFKEKTSDITIRLLVMSADLNFLTVKEAAARSSYSPAYLTRLAKKADIEAKKDGRIWMIQSKSLDRYLSLIEKRKAENRIRLSAERIGKLSMAEYSAAWLFYKANIGAFDTKAALESLAIAGLSALVGMMTHSFMQTGASTEDIYQGSIALMGDLNHQTELIGLGLAELTTKIGGESLLASVWSLFF